MSLLWLVFIPPLVGVVVYPIRKIPLLPSIVSAATMVAVGFVAISLPENQTMFVMGRPFVFHPMARYLFLLMCGSFALLFLYGGGDSPGKLFCPLGLVVTGVLAAVILIQHIAIAALFLELAVIIIALQIPGEDPSSAQCAMRYLVVITIAILPLLIAPWVAEMYQLSPSNTTLPQFILTAVVVSFVILLGVIPFHVWLPPIGEHGPPVVTAVLTAPVSVIVWYRLLDALQRYPWMGADPRWEPFLVAAGMWTMIIGGVLAFSQRNLGRLMGYVAISDLGMILVGTGMGGSFGQQAMLYHWMTRSLALVLMAMSISSLRHYKGGIDIDTLRSSARRFPVATVGLLVSGLSLAGPPLTGGFVARWILIQALIQTSLPQALAFLGSSAAIGWAYLRVLGATLAPPEEPHDAREPLLPSILIAITTILLLALVWYSQPVLDLLHTLAENLFSFGPGG